MCLVLLFNKNNITIFTVSDLKNRFQKKKVADYSQINQIFTNNF